MAIMGKNVRNRGAEWKTHQKVKWLRVEAAESRTELMGMEYGSFRWTKLLKGQCNYMRKKHKIVPDIYQKVALKIREIGYRYKK